MANRSFKLALLFFVLCCAVTAATAVVPQTVTDYSQVYGTVSENTRLQGHNLTLTTRSFLECVITCSITEDCSGVNMCENTCELLSNNTRLVRSGQTESCWVSVILQPQESETKSPTSTTEGVMPTTTSFSCPANFTKIGNSCYIVAKVKTGISFSIAIDLCQDLNASLASLETASELNSLQVYLTGLYPLIEPSVTKSWVIGAHQYNASGTFFWLSGSQVVGDIWAPDEPDKLDRQDCVSLRADEGFKLVNVYCDMYTRQYICEL